jgi:hypothetical protein
MASQGIPIPVDIAALYFDDRWPVQMGDRFLGLLWCVLQTIELHPVFGSRVSRRRILLRPQRPGIVLTASGLALA